VASEAVINQDKKLGPSLEKPFHTLSA